MSETDPVDTVAPWTIKAVPTATRDAVTKAARREGLTVGQWLERRVNEWEGAGSPVTVSSQAPINLGELAHAMDAARALANDAKVEVPPQLAKDGLSLIRQAMRQAKGAMPRPAPRKKPQAAIEDGISAGVSS
jgi:hypothetical protein